MNINHSDIRSAPEQYQFTRPVKPPGFKSGPDYLLPV